MPANRSRTAGWRRCLKQVQERGGALEIAVTRRYSDQEGDGRHLVWRVRLLEVSEQEIIVEQPMTLGQVIELESGIVLVAILSMGQNRWMFTTSVLGKVQRRLTDRKSVEVVRLAMPASVERCQRRNYFRLETAGLTMPEVEVWPLLDPKSVLPAERANELRFHADRDGTPPGVTDVQDSNDPWLLPEVGPRFTAMLLNIGGGGVGLRVDPHDAAAFGRHKVFWLRFNLLPELATPICATGKLVHTNLDSTQHTYAGFAFDFSFNPLHQGLVVEQICRYITMQQRAQLAEAG